MQKNAFLFFWMVLLTACGPDYVFVKEYDIKEGGWAYADSLTFSVPITDTLAVYNLHLEVVHQTDYAYQNLYTRISTTFPAGSHLEKVLSLELADKGGGWLGNCNQRSCELEVPIQQNAFFNEAGVYIITLEQFMRESPVPGLEKISLRLENTGKKRS